MTDLYPAVETAAVVISSFIIATGVLQNVFQIMQLSLAGEALARRPVSGRVGLLWQRYSDLAPPISLLVPAFNEEQTIVESVQALLGLQYTNFEIIVVNDGSSDQTLARLFERFDLVPTDRAGDSRLQHQPLRQIFVAEREPRLIVVDKANGGKFDALNCAINLARAPIVCAIDADSLLEHDSLLRAVAPFVDDPVRTVAVGGTVRVANGCRVIGGRVTEIGLPNRLLPLFQTVEYLRAFLMARLAWSRIGTLTIVSGAFGLFRRQIVADVGGYSADTVGEDLELIIKIHRHMRELGLDYRIEFIPEPVCWTEVPESLRILGRQRARWQRGALETFFKHWDMMFRRRYGRIGMFGMPNMLLVDVIAPVVEVVGYVLVPVLWALGLLSIEFLFAFLAVTFAFGVAISVGALVLEEMELRRYPRSKQLVVLFLSAILENFGYRQLCTIWRVRGFWQYLTGQTGWGHMKRRGFQRV